MNDIKYHNKYFHGILLTANCQKTFSYCRSLLTARKLPLPKVPVIFLKPTSSYITEGQYIEVSIGSFLFWNMQVNCKYTSIHFPIEFFSFLYMKIMYLNFYTVGISIYFMSKSHNSFQIVTASL